MARNTGQRASPSGSSGQSNELERTMLERLFQMTTPAAPPPQSPPTYGASRVTVGMSAVDVLITFGITRQIIDQSTGMPGNDSAIEWLASYSISPITATQVRDILTAIIDQYERKYGSIPKDPDFKINISSE